MGIWRFADRLVMIAEVADDFPHDSDAVPAQTIKHWESEMDEFKVPLRAEGPKWAGMRSIFPLHDQPEHG